MHRAAGLRRMLQCRVCSTTANISQNGGPPQGFRRYFFHIFSFRSSPKKDAKDPIRNTPEPCSQNSLPEIASWLPNVEFGKTDSTHETEFLPTTHQQPRASLMRADQKCKASLRTESHCRRRYRWPESCPMGTSTVKKNEKLHLIDSTQNTVFYYGF